MTVTARAGRSSLLRRPGWASVGRTRLPAAAGLAVVLAAACVLVARQPVSSPWWIYSDADATYAGSALRIASGGHTEYLDHPGLVDQEILALSFAAASIPDGGPTRAWADREMLHLGRVIPITRGWAIFFFVGGAALAFFLVTRLLGHWTWGVAGGLLWLAQPDLSDSIQIRPDVLLAALALIVGFVAIQGVERRSPLAFVLAAVVLGFAIMVKLHAVALLALLLVAAVFGYPGADWPTRARNELGPWLDRHRFGIALALASWTALAVVVNVRAAPSLGPWPLRTLAELGFVLADYTLVALAVRRWMRNRLVRRVFDPFFSLLALAVAVGIFVPIGLLVDDGMRALGSISNTLTGRGVSSGVPAFSEPASIFTAFPLRQALVVFGLAGVATLWGLHRRSPWPAVWFAGALATGVMAAARLGYVRYFALPYVLSIPAALWLFRGWTRRAAPLLVWVLVGYVLVPTFQHSGDNASAAQGIEQLSEAATRLGDQVLKPGEAALVPDQFPLADVRWLSLGAFTVSPPAYPFRFVDDWGPAVAAARQDHLRLRYFIGPQAVPVTSPTSLTLNSGTYRVRPLPRAPGSLDGLGVVEIVSGPT